MKSRFLNPVPLKRRYVLLFLLPALLLAACGSTPATGTPVTPTPTQPAPVIPEPTPTPTPAPTTGMLTLTVVLQNAQANSATALRVQYAGSDQTIDLSRQPSTEVAGGRQYSLTLTLPAADQQALTVTAANATGDSLGTSSQALTLAAGGSTALILTLGGIVKTASFGPLDRASDVTTENGTQMLDLGGAYHGAVSLQDAAGGTVLTSATLTLTSSNPAFVVTAASDGSYTVTAPDPTGAAQSTTLSVGLTGPSGTVQVLASENLIVPAETVALTLSNTAPVAGSPLLATAALHSARGRALPVAGRPVTFSAQSGIAPASPVATDASGSATATLVSAPQVGEGTVTASVDGVISSAAAFHSVAGTPSHVTSTVTLRDSVLQVQGSTVLTVTLRDLNGNPVTATPIIRVDGLTLSAPTRSGDTLMYTVTASLHTNTSIINILVDGQDVGQATLTVKPYPIVVMDGNTTLTSGSSRFDFKSRTPHSFMASEQAYGFDLRASSSNSAVATVNLQGGVLTVTPGTQAGFATITLSDTHDTTFSQTFKFEVSVTTLGIHLD